MRDLVYPAETVYREQMRAAGTPHYQPPVLEELKEQARARGLWNLFLPHKTEWTDGLSNLDYAPLCEILGRSFIAPEVLNCSAPDTGNMELLTLFGTDRAAGALAAAAARGADPLRLPDDRAGRGQLGRDQYPDPDRARRRRLGDQRPQVVDLRDRRPALPAGHRDGQDRPGGRQPRAAEHDPRPARQPRDHDPARPDGVRLQRPRGALRDRPRQRPGAGRQPARHGRRRVRDVPGPARPGPDPPLHALDRRGRAGARAAVPAGAGPGGVRRPARRQGRRPGGDRRQQDRDRPGPAADPARGLADGHRRQQGRPRRRSPPSRSRCRRWRPG